MKYPGAKEEKEQYGERYALAKERVREICEEMTQTREATVPERFQKYFQTVSAFAAQMTEVYDSMDDGSFYTWSEDALRAWNHRLYEDILPEHYAESYANPSYAARMLGEFGTVLCVLYAELRELLVYVYEKRLFFLVTGLELLIEIYDLLEDGCTPQAVRNAIYYYVSDYADITVADRTDQMLNPERDFAISLIRESAEMDLRYLYFFGDYIGTNERETAAYLRELPQTQIDSMARTFTGGFRKGFALYGLDLAHKKTVNLRFRLGFERLIGAVAQQFQEMGLAVTMYRAAGNLIYRNGSGVRAGYGSGGANPQYDYDHRFDEALVFGKALADRKLVQQRCAYEERRALADGFAGPAVTEVFGEKTFVPAACGEAVTYSAKQKKQLQEYRTASALLTNTFLPGDQRSFSIIAYPLPSIGRDYQEIFQETVRVNTLDSDRYQQIQQRLIDALDQAETVTVTGRNGNHTNLTVALPRLEDPAHQTNFENCLADVNIPLGEVFTSPQLSGTNGTLHVKQVYLNALKYVDLSLEIRDGMVTDYTCATFDAEEENKKYIAQNILYQYPSLPMGEFAIGTNTTAYAMGEKYGISHILPILIAEKTGPHFAFGDTCYAQEEDLVTYNPDGKRMMAKENSISALRRTAPEKAYFHCHTDITIPYSELGDVTVHCRDGGTIALLRDGRFVLEGTEELNQYAGN